MSPVVLSMTAVLKAGRTLLSGSRSPDGASSAVICAVLPREGGLDDQGIVEGQPDPWLTM